MDDDIISIEPIDEGQTEKPLILVYNDPEGGISFKSSLDPLMTARIFIGLGHHILENHIG